MKHLNKFEHFNDNVSFDHMTEDITDILLPVTDEWKVISSYMTKRHGCKILQFRLHSKNDVNLLRIGDSDKFENSYIYDNELEEIKDLVSHTRLNEFGYRLEFIRWFLEDNGEVTIAMDIMEPSWWSKDLEHTK